jgi:hypothetical protein
MSGSRLKPSDQGGRLSAELCGAWNLKPYWGKPTVRNFRGGGWKRDHGSRTEAHDERRGTATGPYHARASAPPDHMAGASKPVDVFTKQRRIAELARQSPEMGFTSLAYFIDIDWLREAYRRTRKDGAVGVDGQNGADYAADLENNLRSLLDRAKSGTYQAPPVRRSYIDRRRLGFPADDN